MRTIFCILLFAFFNVWNAHAQDSPVQCDIVVNHVKCFGEETGSITLSNVVVEGKTGIMSFYLTKVDETPISELKPEPVFTEWAAGIYKVRVDIEDDSFFTEAIEVEQPALLEIASKITTPACRYPVNGTAEITVSGGMAPYEFTINEFPQVTQPELSLIVADLKEGSYHVSVVDFNGCTADDSFNVGSIPIFTATAEQTKLVRCDPVGGALSVSAIPSTGGSDEFRYKLEESDWQEEPVFEGLEEGAYTVTVIDGDNCKVMTNEVTLRKAHTEVTATGSNVQCWSEKGTIDAKATVENDLDGTSGKIDFYQLLWKDGIRYSGEKLSDDGIFFFDELSAENYTVSVKDSYGCVSTASATVYEPESLLGLDFKEPQPPYGTTMGSITVTLSGGWGGYTIVCNKIRTTGFPQEVARRTNLNAGDHKFDNLNGYQYQFLITDKGGCFNNYFFEFRVTGETDLESPNLKIYPNPSGDGIFFIDWDGVDNRRVTIEIFNMNQQLIYKTNAQTGTRTAIDLSNQSSGVYLLRVAELNIREKIVIQ